MRRSDREITDRNEILEVMKKCDVCRLAFNNAEDGYPYLLPLNFGMRTDGGQIILYFHGAKEGQKYKLIAKDNRVSFEMDCAHQLVTDEASGNCTMNYESVIGKGRIEVICEEEKEDALRVLMQHYHKEDFLYNKAVVPQTVVLKLTVEEMSGKRRKKRD